MVYLKSCISYKDIEYLSWNMHIAAERQCKEEEAKSSGVGPPGGKHVHIIAKEIGKEHIYRFCKEASAADSGCEALCQ